MTQKLFTKNFVLLILGQLTSLFGNFILKLALSMYVLEKNRFRCNFCRDLISRVDSCHPAFSAGRHFSGQRKQTKYYGFIRCVFRDIRMQRSIPDIRKE